MATDVRTLSTESELSAYLHRVRMQILDALRDGPATVTQVAATLGVHPANLSRHIRVLEDAGLVALVEKRDTGRNLEKYYGAVAGGFRVAPEPGTLTAAHKIALSFARSELSVALARLPDESTDPVTALALGVRIRASKAKAFAEELAKLGERFSAADESDGQAYRLVLALYPGEAVTVERPQSIRLTTPKDAPDTTPVRRVASALASLGQSALRRAGRQAGIDLAAKPAWDAWRAGDFALAREQAADLVASGQALDDARHVLALVASVLGQYDEAIATHRLISPRYPRLAELDEPMLWAHVHNDDVAGAGAFATRRGLARQGGFAKRLRLAIDHPLSIEIDGVVDIPFTNDALTPLMPGFAARLNGRPTVARLDTGGSFVHLSSEAAAAHGIDTVDSEQEFAALSWHTVRYGLGDLDIGPVHLRNVPVAVHEGALPAAPIGTAFGVELGPIIGTNVLERFLTTVDAPGRRLVLSRRGDEPARAAHLADVGVPEHEAPFAVWGDHLMIARGRIGDVLNANLFVDSGLVAFTEAQGQAALLASRRAVASWGVPVPGPGRFADIPGSLSIGPASRDGMTAHAVPDATWRDFGDWGGIRVDALISWGFLRHFSWTIDFDRRRYLFTAADPGAVVPT